MTGTRVRVEHWYRRRVHEIYYECASCKRRVRASSQFCDWCGERFDAEAEEVVQH